MQKKKLQTPNGQREKNWVYYMIEGIKNMFGKRTPSNWIEGMSIELKSRRLN